MFAVGLLLAAASAAFFIARILGAGVSLASLGLVGVVAFVFAELDAHDDVLPKGVVAAPENAV